MPYINDFFCLSIFCALEKVFKWFWDFKHLSKVYVAIKDKESHHDPPLPAKVDKTGNNSNIEQDPAYSVSPVFSEPPSGHFPILEYLIEVWHI